MSDGYPYFFLKADIGEAFVERVVTPMGGKKFDGSQQFPDGVRVVDFLVGDYGLEFKRLETDPIVQVPERVNKVANFAMEKVLKGETPANGGTINLTGAASQLYWRKFAGVAIGRAFNDAAEQIKSTRNFLKRSDLKGAVFIVNVCCPFIDAESLSGLVGVQQERFADTIGVAIFFSAVPGAVEGYERPVVLFGFRPENSEHDAFAEQFQQEFQRELAMTLGKTSLHSVSAPKVLPLRFPFHTKTDDGTPITIH